MRKSVLMADGRPTDNQQDLYMMATQRLIEQYPVIWRIEFQNRGSPPVYMVVWVEGHASFDTEEELHQLNQVCSCDYRLRHLNSTI
ncbi:hypothetical protein TNCV_1496841 [Trichonephila clavipes]|nr:hypothetical protein TNCV_1496841 [Trichonephila clavipes]